MNKTELVNLIAEKSELTKAQSQKALDSVLEVISERLAYGEPITLFGLGTFKVNPRNARKGRNPNTCEEITIAACNVPAFTPSKSLKDKVQE